MKKYFLLLTLITFVLTLIGCKGSKKANVIFEGEINNDSYVYYVSVSDNKDGSFNINLSGNPTTGYEWTVLNTNGKFNISVSEGTYIKGITDKNITGAGGTYTFIVTPNITDSNVPSDLACVTFQYKRSWEEESIATYEITFIIDEARGLVVDGYK